MAIFIPTTCLICSADTHSTVEKSIKLLEEEGDQYCQANDQEDEGFPILKHDSLL